MTERIFQAKMIKEIKKRFPGCEVLKNDPSYIQGIPDLTILYKSHWATLECKSYQQANRQPNQQYYVDRFNEMSFSAFINPENWEDVLNEMEHIFET